MNPIKLFFAKYQLPIYGIVFFLLCFYIGSLKLQVGHWHGEYDAAQGTIKKQKGEIAEWDSSYRILAKVTYDQNTAIESMEQATKLAKEKGHTAKKTAQPILDHRQAQINQADAHVVKPDSCDAAVERAKKDLAGSLL